MAETAKQPAHRLIMVRAGAVLPVAQQGPAKLVVTAELAPALLLRVRVRVVVEQTGVLTQVMHHPKLLPQVVTIATGSVLVAQELWMEVMAKMAVAVAVAPMDQLPEQAERARKIQSGLKPQGLPLPALAAVAVVGVEVTHLVLPV